MQCLLKDCQLLRTENAQLKSQMKNTSLDEKSLIKDDRRVLILTGIPTYQSVMYININKQCTKTVRLQTIITYFDENEIQFEYARLGFCLWCAFINHFKSIS